MNPYASFLGDRDPLEVMKTTPQRFAAKLDELGPEAAVRSPAPGKWSFREVLCHLADCEVVFAFRLRQTLAEPGHTVQAFDQDKWAKPYASLDAHAALETFRAVRNWNLAMLATVLPEAYDTRVSHPERGEMSFRTVVETMAGHDLNHVEQLGRYATASASSPA